LKDIRFAASFRRKIFSIVRRHRFFRDAAPTGSVVGGVGTASMGYAENNRTMGEQRRSKIELLGQERSDATASILANWKTGTEYEVVEDGDSCYLVTWMPLQAHAGAQGATTSDPITKSAATRADPEKTFADPPTGPRAAAQDAHRQMFDRIIDHDCRKPAAARKALKQIKQSVDALESINEENRKFYGGKK
jgi:hypothetical protein